MNETIGLDPHGSAPERAQPIRIWWQSFVDRSQNAPYLDRLATYLTEIAAPGTVVDVYGMSPPDRGFGRLTELRCSVLAVDAALEAAERGYDAYAMGHFQDPGLFAARSAASIPIVGLGEAALHWAAQLGRHIGLVSIDEVFGHWHREQADLYGLPGRIISVRALNAVVEDFAEAFTGNKTAYARLLEAFDAAAVPGVENGVDVVVIAGGLPGLLFATQRAMSVGRAPVVNPVPVALKAAEMAVQLVRITGTCPSGGPCFAPAPDLARTDFRAFVKRGLA